MSRRPIATCRCNCVSPAARPADPAAIKAAGANIIVDFGTLDADYSAIADRTQSAAGIPMS